MSILQPTLRPSSPTKSPKRITPSRGHLPNLQKIVSYKQPHGGLVNLGGRLWILATHRALFYVGVRVKPANQGASSSSFASTRPAI